MLDRNKVLAGAIPGFELSAQAALPLLRSQPIAQAAFRQRDIGVADRVVPWEVAEQPASFGQPASRAIQVFGSGGPRAFQFGVRLAF